ETIVVDVKEAAVPDYSLYINAGSSLTVNYEGRDFIGDQNNPAMYGSGNSAYYYGSVQGSELLKSGRYGLNESVRYSLNVPNGIYKITTYHLEGHFKKASPGREFDILIQGVLVRDNLNLYATAG